MCICYVYFSEIQKPFTVIKIDIKQIYKTSHPLLPISFWLLLKKKKSHFKRKNKKKNPENKLHPGSLYLMNLVSILFN